jgi:chlorobactene glucosyltransferase
MYTNLQDIWEGFSKHTVEILGKGKIGLTLYEAFKVLLLGVMPVGLPVVNWFVYLGGSQSTLDAVFLMLSLLESGVVFSIYLYVAIFLNIPFWYGLLFPLGMIVQTMIILKSISMKIMKKTTWKGRQYIEKTSD